MEQNYFNAETLYTSKTKQKYFDSCKLALEQEKLLLKIVTEKEKRRNSNDEEISFAHGNILFKKTYY